MDNGYNNQQYTQQNNTQQYYNQPNYQPNNTQPNSQLNNQPGNNQSPKKSGKKSAIIVLCIILAVALGGAGIGVGSHFLSENSKGYEAVVASLEEGKYSEALQVYEDKYGYGNSDMELNDALVQRLLEIEDEFLEGEISYNKAIKEVETIGSMGIIAIEDDVAKTLLYVEQLEKKNNPVAKEPETLKEAPTVNLATEPLPQISNNPAIRSATTLKGSVLAASNVNGARSFGADKAIDGYYDSCWCVNTNSTGGMGASIRFDLAQKSTVSGVQIVNGNLYRPYEDIYRSNGQVKNFTLTFSDGTSQSFFASYNDGYDSFYENFYLNKPVVTDYIILTVHDGYVGAKYTTNVCLGEFDVF